MLVTISVKKKDLTHGSKLSSEKSPVCLAIQRKLKPGVQVSLWTTYGFGIESNWKWCGYPPTDLYEYDHAIAQGRPVDPRKFLLVIPDEYLNQKTIDKYTQESTNE